MVKITGTYQGSLRCQSRHEPSGQLLETDAPRDNQGMGASYSPTDLCAAALATCMVTTIAIQARTSSIPVEGMRYEVTKIMSTEPPRRIARLETHLYFQEPLEPAQQVRLVRAARTCPVHRSLHPDIEKPLTFHWADGKVEQVDF